MATNKKAGFVYLLTNPSYDKDKVKIGRVESDDIQKLKARVRALSSHPGVAEPFELRYAVRVDDVHKAENLLHDAFGWVRKNKRREFFDIAPEKVEAAMKLTLVRGSDCVPVALVDAYSLPMKPGDTPPPLSTPTGARERRPLSKQPLFNFGDYGIPVGAELTFNGDSSLKATVADNTNQVKFEGDVFSLTGAAKVIMERTGRSPRVSGTRLWLYKGKALKEFARGKNR